MSSRLARDRLGRLVVVVTAPQPGCDAGARFLALGNTLEAAGTGVWFLGVPTGRRAERAGREAPANGRPGQPRQVWPPDYPERARMLHAQGLSCPKVAEQLEVPFGTAKSWIWAESQTWAHRKARRQTGAWSDVEDDRHRPVVDDLERHASAENPGLDRDAQLA